MFGNMVSATSAGKTDPEVEWQGTHSGDPNSIRSNCSGAIKLFMEEKLDPIFHADSYGYRPGKSAHDALKQCAIRCWRYSWILEVDISAFFDHVRHDLVLKALEHHGMPKWVILYCRRWMEAPMQSCENGELITRTRGTPQGGVISPLLANLFLHYAFDLWMEREYRGYRLRGTLTIL